MKTREQALDCMKELADRLVKLIEEEQSTGRVNEALHHTIGQLCGAEQALVAAR